MTVARDLAIGSLFSGIGGLELGLEWAGLGKTSWQVEQSKFCRHVLAKHWPEAKRCTDVKEVGGHNLSPVDLVCGGFPCQDISVAGRGAGLAGERSGLWYEMLRVVGELRPRWIVIENVYRGWRRWVPFVRSDLWRIGYSSVPIRVRACEVGLPHERSRGFIIADAECQLLREQSGRSGRAYWEEALQLAVDGANEAFADIESEQMGSPGFAWNETRGIQGAIEPHMVRGIYGIPARMDRVKALGNAVVPPVAMVVGLIIQEVL